MFNVPWFCTYTDLYISCAITSATLWYTADLPHSNNGVGNENEQNDEGLNEGCDSLFTFLKPSQHLQKDRQGLGQKEHGSKHWNIAHSSLSETMKKNVPRN